MLSDLTEFEKNPSLIFEYKYSTPDGDTKYFDKVGNAAPNPAAVKSNEPVSVEVEFDEDDDDYDEDEVSERRSPLLPILFAVACAFVVITAGLVAAIFSGMIGDGGGIGGARNREMPNLFQMDYDDAVRAYDWLTLNANWVHSNDYPNGTIFEQDVTAGKLFNPTQTTVNVTVSMGAKVIFMPDFSRHPITGDEVVAQLRSLGLNPVPVEIYHETVPKDFFIRTERKPDDELNEGDTVQVFISRGQDIPLTTRVPNFVGLTIHTARENAENMRLRLRETPIASDQEAGRIIQQSIQEHTEVNNDTEIEVLVSTGVPEVAPEDVERDFHISFRIGENWTGQYEFRLYRNGVLLPEKTQVMNVGISKNFRVEFTDKGSGIEYSVEIVSIATGKDGIYATHEIDFTTEPPTRNVKYENTRLFAQISVADPEPATPSYDY
jgi:serine/threonine-protein kinase